MLAGAVLTSFWLVIEFLNPGPPLHHPFLPGLPLLPYLSISDTRAYGYTSLMTVGPLVSSSLLPGVLAPSEALPRREFRRYSQTFSVKPARLEI